jgi:hypothetical protein
MTKNISDEVARNYFDNFDIPSALAAQMRAAALRVQQLDCAAAIYAGRELLAVKKLLGQREFQEWLRYEVKMPIRSARRAMRMAEISYLPVAALPRLISWMSGGDPSVGDVEDQIQRAVEEMMVPIPCEAVSFNNAVAVDEDEPPLPFMLPSFQAHMA